MHTQIYNTDRQTDRLWPCNERKTCVFQSEAQRQLEEMKAFRSKMKEVADEARQKEDLQKQLVSVCECEFVCVCVYVVYVCV